MAIGENVGSAYVKLYADGDDVPDDIDRAMDRLEPKMREAGEEHAEAYQKGFDKQQKKDSEKTRSRMYRDLQKGLGRFHAIGETLGTDFFDGLQLQLTRELNSSDLGKLIRDRLEDDFALTGSFDRLSANLRDLNRLAGEGQLELDRLEDEARRFAEQDLARQHKKDMSELERQIKDTINETDDLYRATKRWADLGRRAADEATDNLRAYSDELDAGIERTNRWTREFVLAKHEESSWSLGFQRRLHGINEELDRSATRVGRLFGKGSRNDLLNFVGSAVEGLSRLAFLAPKALEGLLGGGGGGGGGKFVATVLKGIGSSIIGITIALAALVTVLGPVAALVSGLTAAVIALVGSLGFALGAIGGVALALTGPLLAGILGVKLAIDKLDQQTITKLNGFKKEFLELGEVAADTLGPKLRKAVDIAQPALAGLEPLFAGIGDSVGRVAVEFAELTKSSAYKAFVRDITDFIPGAIESLGTSAANFGKGMMGVFRSTIPMTEDFLGWLEKITERFSEWANSVEGQRELGDFFDRAADSARAVGGFIDDAISATGKLLSLGRGTGDTLFDSMARSMRRLTTYLEDHPDAVASWFGNGKQVATDLGDLLLDIGEAIDKLDNEETRKQLSDLLQIIGAIVQGVGWIGETWAKVTDSVGDQLSIFSTGFENLQSVIDATGWAAKATGDLLLDMVTAPKKATDGLVGLDWGKMFSGIGGAIENTWSQVTGLQDRIIGRFAGFGGRITKAMGKVHLRDILNAVGIGGRITGAFAGMAGRAFRAIGKVQLKDIVNPAGVVNAVLSPFRGLAKSIIDVIGDVDLKDLVNVGGVVEAVVGPFRGLASSILSAIGTVDIGSLIKIPDPGGGIPFVPGVAAGDWFGDVTKGPRLRWIGEDGPEAIVPLDRPLSKVNPRVRDLSAIAQGLVPVGGGGQVVVESGAIQINEVEKDPRATAEWALNELVARVA